MRASTKILIADINSEFRDLLEQSLRKEPDFEIIGTASDGLEALHMFEKLTPDIILMDLVLPKIDGLGVLAAIQTMTVKPIIFLMSSFTNECVERDAALLGAYYFILKPFDHSVLIKHLRQAVLGGESVKKDSTPPATASGDTAKKTLTDIFCEFGIPNHVLGYQYLREAISMAVKDMTVLESITKVLYPQVAKTFESTSSKVERSIRHAIEIAWNTANLDIKNKYFSYIKSDLVGKPTNSEFIAIIADRIRLLTTDAAALGT